MYRINKEQLKKMFEKARYTRLYRGEKSLLDLRVKVKRKTELFKINKDGRITHLYIQDKEMKKRRITHLYIEDKEMKNRRIRKHKEILDILEYLINNNSGINLFNAKFFINNKNIILNDKRLKKLLNAKVVIFKRDLKNIFNKDAFITLPVQFPEKIETMLLGNTIQYAEIANVFGTTKQRESANELLKITFANALKSQPFKTSNKQIYSQIKRIARPLLDTERLEYLDNMSNMKDHESLKLSSFAMHRFNNSYSAGKEIDNFLRVVDRVKEILPPKEFETLKPNISKSFKELYLGIAQKNYSTSGYLNITDSHYDNWIKEKHVSVGEKVSSKMPIVNFDRCMMSKNSFEDRLTRKTAPFDFFTLSGKDSDSELIAPIIYKNKENVVKMLKKAEKAYAKKEYLGDMPKQLHEWLKRSEMKSKTRIENKIKSKATGNRDL